MIYEITNEPIKNITIDYKTLSRSKKDAEEGLEELMANIQQHGLIQPIGIYPIAYKKYRLLFGLRRLLACKRLGMKTIRAATHIFPGKEEIND